MRFFKKYVTTETTCGLFFIEVMVLLAVMFRGEQYIILFICPVVYFVAHIHNRYLLIKRKKKRYEKNNLICRNDGYDDLMRNSKK
jgi:hypothetical protein